LEKATGHYVVRQLGNYSRTHYAEARVKSPSLNRRFVVALPSPTIFVETGLRFPSWHARTHASVERWMGDGHKAGFVMPLGGGSRRKSPISRIENWLATIQ